MNADRPWRGLYTATALPFHEDLSIDYDSYAEHVAWLAEAGAESVLLLPPNTYRADREAVLNHYRAAAAVGLPIVAYNNPIDTKVDLTPDVVAQLFDENLIVAVKEFTGDVRRAWEIAELAPGLDLLVGSDDVVVELGLAGA